MTSTNDYELKKLIMMQQARRPLEPHADRVNKSNLHYARSNTLKRVTRGRGPSPLLCARPTQLRRNIATVASRWRHCRFYRPWHRTPDLPHQ